MLIATYLSRCGYATLDSDTTASLNFSASSPIRRAPPATPSASTDSLSTTSDKTSAAALNSTTEAAATPIGSPPNAAVKVIEPRGRAYLFRGVAGLIYSRGMDHLAYGQAFGSGSSTDQGGGKRQPEGTLLRLTHWGLPNAEQCAGHAEGWTHYLGRLIEVAAGRDQAQTLGHGRTGS